MGQLTTTQERRLAEHEATIRNGLESWIDVSRALIEIHDANLWIGKGKSFIGYCKDEFGINKSRVWQLIDSCKAADEVSTIVDTPTPQSEGVAREIAKVESEQERADLWAKATETAADNTPTAAHVAKTRKAMFQPEESNGEPEADEPEPLWQQFAAKHADALKHLTQAMKAIKWIEKQGEDASYLAAVITRIKSDYKTLRGTISSNCPVGMSDGKIRTKVQERK